MLRAMVLSVVLPKGEDFDSIGFISRPRGLHLGNSVGFLALSGVIVVPPLAIPFDTMSMDNPKEEALGVLGVGLSGCCRPVVPAEENEDTASDNELVFVFVFVFVLARGRLWPWSRCVGIGDFSTDKS